MATMRERLAKQFAEEQALEQADEKGRAEASDSGVSVASSRKVQTQGPARVLRESLAMLPVRKQTQIQIEQVVVPDHFKRHEAEYDGADFADLMSSIEKSHGNLVPIDVRFRPDQDGRIQYEVIAGTRRVEAIRRLGLKSVFANEREIDDGTADLLHDIENAKRSEKRPFSLAMQLSSMMKSGRYSSQANLAERLGRTEGMVSLYLALYDDAPNGLWDRVKDPAATKKRDAELLVKAYKNRAFRDWVKTVNKATPASLASVLKKAAELTSKPKAERSEVEKVREMVRKDEFYIVLPQTFPAELRAQVLAFARELAAKV